MEITFNYKFKNWNKIINESRTNYYLANKSKKEEMEYVKWELISQKIEPITEYPIKINCLWGCKSCIADLDNKSIKSILDQMQASNILKEDNMKHITEINHKYIKATEDYLIMIIDKV